MERSATAVWEGAGKEGKGSLTTQSGVLHQTQYSYSSRFADSKGTNPEELIAAAHAGCYAMKLSLTLSGSGFASEKLDVKSIVTIENGTIISSALTLNATVRGIDPDQFHELAELAKKDCPVSKALNCEITLESHLEH